MSNKGFFFQIYLILYITDMWVVFTNM